MFYHIFSQKYTFVSMIVREENNLIGGRKMNVANKKIEMVILLGVLALLLFLVGVAFKITALLVGGSVPFIVVVGYAFFLFTHIPTKSRK